jgi:hypothetical protein
MHFENCRYLAELNTNLEVNCLKHTRGGSESFLKGLDTTTHN